MTWQIDGALYPDEPPPKRLRSLAERIDFIARLCGAWDFGLLPDWETLNEVRRKPWRRAVDECRLLTSPTYHLLREWHGLPPLPFLGSIPAYIRDDPNLNFI
ncbi:MAG: hypothetical protein HY259_14740 [Chloroflexi bacterium]|nr:hypothetical protein [Chloroflexota bacterium]MBI3734693.1 hypothetical protein [Chloroflexota bacterium]